MRQVAGGEDVRRQGPMPLRGTTTLGQVHFEKGAMPPLEAGERVKRLDHARSLRPAAARAGSQRDDGDLTGLQRAAAVVRELTADFVPGVDYVARPNILDDSGGGQAILGQADQTAS